MKMDWFKTMIHYQTRGQGFFPITDLIQKQINTWDIKEGICFLFIQHSSASIVINESYDPSAKMDMEEFLNRLAPKLQPWYRHTMEGSDDSPSHLKSLITPVSLSIPVDNGQLSLGTWQGIYLIEHREHRQERRILMRCLSV
jgi:secondary thiamine-phosphate synthase enzyme